MPTPIACMESKILAAKQLDELSLEIIGVPFLFTSEEAVASVEKATLKNPKRSNTSQHTKNVSTVSGFDPDLVPIILKRLVIV